jgi:hypothetical protein
MKAEVSLPNGTEIKVETTDHLDQIKAAFDGLVKALEATKEKERG